MSRGGSNIEYYNGYKMESNLFTRYIPLLKKILQTEVIEITTRSLIDKHTGTDAVAMIQGNLIGISLRFRNSDFNSFTLSRHITDKVSEIHKWSKPRAEDIKPAYFIQISKRRDGRLRVIKVNIDAFGYYLRYLINTDQLEQFYKPKLMAYDFNLDLVTGLEYEIHQEKDINLSFNNVELLNTGF